MRNDFTMKNVRFTMRNRYLWNMGRLFRNDTSETKDTERKLYEYFTVNVLRNCAIKSEVFYAAVRLS